eukprot:753892-Hanusia_phi.AAC.2
MIFVILNNVGNSLGIRLQLIYADLEMTIQAGQVFILLLFNPSPFWNVFLFTFPASPPNLLSPASSCFPSSIPQPPPPFPPCSRCNSPPLHPSSHAVQRVVCEPEGYALNLGVRSLTSNRHPRLLQLDQVHLADEVQVRGESYCEQKLSDQQL